MPTETEYVLQRDGSITRRITTEQKVDVSDQVVSALTQNTHAKLPNVASHPRMGKVGLCLVGAESYWTVNLSHLVMRCPWRLTSSGVLVPMFNSTTDPVMTINWVVPDGLRLKMLVRVIHDKSGEAAQASWLFATDPKLSGTWRIPIANVHDDCSCCTGCTAKIADNSLDAVAKWIENFDQAPYNADLWRGAEQTHKFFRVKPAGSGEFETQPIDAKYWSDLCVKIGIAVSAYLI
jgi:hypothetical protein